MKPKLHISALDPLSKIGHEAVNQWRRDIHTIQYPAWEDLEMPDQDLRRKLVENILDEENVESTSDEERVFIEAVQKQAKEWKLL